LYSNEINLPNPPLSNQAQSREGNDLLPQLPWPDPYRLQQLTYSKIFYPAISAKLKKEA
jgi:hypothetical protein